MIIDDAFVHDGPLFDAVKSARVVFEILDHQIRIIGGWLPFRAQVTGSALTEMGIQAGQMLWAVFKASSCFLVQEDVSIPDVTQPPA